MNRRALLRSIVGGSKNVRFSDMVGLVEGFGFRFDRQTGSHHIFIHADVPELVNLQNVTWKGEAVPGSAVLENRGEVQPGAGGLMKNYHINVFYSEDDEGWIADIPDLEMCSAFGRTPVEALQEVELAMAAWLEAAQGNGRPVPEPRYRPAIYQTLAA